ncbi:MAG TPA: methyltransferase domain-containing protein [Gemmatimonadaceae bacterium]|nr:methyltransferase domain-containing protein [Gemmatimonadaceae bacterium]
MTTAADLAAREAALRAAFDVVDSEVMVAGETIHLLRPARADLLISEEDFARDERLPYWADIWPSSTALATHVRGLHGAGRQYLELGCGLGLACAAAAAAGFTVTASDYYDDALRFTEFNVLRHAGVLPATRNLDWRDLPDDLPRYDVVVASDVLYERPYAELVADVLARTLAPEGEAWVADPGRIAVGLFLDECARRGLQMERAVTVPFEEGEIRQTITLHHFWLPPRPGAPPR